MNAAIVSLHDAARSYVESSRSANTRRAYSCDWSAFVAWCRSRGCQPLPVSPADAALYLTHLAQSGRKVSTVARALSSISDAHRAAGCESPRRSAEVRAVWRGISRQHGAEQRRAAPLLPEQLRLIVVGLAPRNRAILLLGFAGAMRRSEIASLDLEDIVMVPDGARLHLQRSKTDQEALGREIGIPFGANPSTCPIAQLRAYMTMRGDTPGPLFPSRTGRRLDGRDIARLIKRACRTIGLDPARYSGHSLRVGLATAAARAGKSERAIMAQTGHSSVVMVRKYIRSATLFSDNAAQGVGL